MSEQATEKADVLYGFPQNHKAKASANSRKKEMKLILLSQGNNCKETNTWTFFFC